MWPLLKDYLLKQVASAADDMHFMCNYCKPLIRRDKIPARCVLNGLHVVEIPPEFSRLDCLSKQFMQLAKAYQTVVQLGTYTAKVLTYNSLKACKGSMLFLPLPLDKTLQTLEEIGENTTLASSELYIIVNGRPTKSKVVWRTLVDVNHIKAAVCKLREINWLYKHIHEDCVDEAVCEVVEVVKNTTSTMLEKATKEDIADMHCYTIRSLNSKQFSEDDMEQYKLVNVKEHPMDNRHKFLDVMCFPALFSDRQFGEYHQQHHKLSHIEYIKSHLLNNDSRFRKDPRYVLYLLWLKEMRELLAGVHNVLKSHIYLLETS